MSIIVQQGWSMKHEVNFLAANVQYISYSDNKLQYASSGSRMYSSGYAKNILLVMLV